MANDPWGPTLRGLDRLQQVRAQQQARSDALGVQAYNRERQGKYDEIDLAKGEYELAGLENKAANVKALGDYAKQLDQGEKYTTGQTYEGPVPLGSEQTYNYSPQQKAAMMAAKQAELTGNYTDLSNRLDATAKERIKGTHAAYINGGGGEEGKANAARYINATAPPSERAAALQRLNDVVFNPQGMIGPAPDGGFIMTTIGANGNTVVKHIAGKVGKVPDKFGEERTIDIDGKKVRQQLNETTGKWVTSAQGSTANKEGSFDNSGNLTLNNGQTFTVDELRNLGETYYKTGKVPSVGRKNSMLRAAIVKEGTNVAIESEQSGFNVAGSWAETKAQGSSLVKQKANMDFATAFVDNIDKQIVQAKSRLEEIQRNYPRLANTPIRLWEEKVLGVEERNMVRMWVKEISAETARLSQGNPQSISEMSASAVKAWDNILDLDIPLKGFIKLLDETKKSGRLRLDSMRTQYSRTLKQAGQGPTTFNETSKTKTPVKPLAEY